MATKKTLTYAAASLVVSGWLLVGVFEEKALGATLFLVGFVTLAAVVIVQQFNIAASLSSPLGKIGLRLGAAGFATCCIAGILDFASASSIWSERVFYMGLIGALVGVAFITLAAANGDRPN